MLFRSELDSRASLRNLPETFPELFSSSHIVRVIEVAKQYLPREVRRIEDMALGIPITHSPEYTLPGGPNTYHCTEIATGWTQGFFPGSLWLMAERELLRPGTLDSAVGNSLSSVPPGYSLPEVVELARKWQSCFRHQTRPAINHDQGFRFQPCYGRDFEFYQSADSKSALIEAADSLVDRYDPKMGCIRSWDSMYRTDKPDLWREDNLDEHYLVIADNMMNLDILYLASVLTGQKHYADIATTQASIMQQTHIRKDGSTYHVVDLGKPGDQPKGMTAQGYADNSTWSRGQAWIMYGMAQCALRTGRPDFISTARRVADFFLSKLSPSGVPWWDINAPKPCPYDASAGTVAARACQMLYLLLRKSDQTAAERYLRAGFKLVEDILRECAAPPAAFTPSGVEWGEGGWEPILMHSSIDGNPGSPHAKLDHGLVYADYYLLEFANEALKLKNDLGEGVGENGDKF